MWPIDSGIFYLLMRLLGQTGVFRLFRKKTAAV